MENKVVSIAVDGPAGAGKSTAAKILAKDLGIDYVDTGAMYRAIALKLVRTGVDCHDPEALAAMLADTDVDFSAGKTLLDGEDVSSLIRTQEISDMASVSSAVLAIREKLVSLQQAMGKRKPVVMDGRDIGTKVMPFAPVKFYLTASSTERAKRRTLELQAKGQPADFEKIKQEIEERDYRDIHRENSPLAVASDATVIDSSNLDAEETVSVMKAVMNEKLISSLGFPVGRNEE